MCYFVVCMVFAVVRHVRIHTYGWEFSVVILSIELYRAGYPLLAGARQDLAPLRRPGQWVPGGNGRYPRKNRGVPAIDYPDIFRLPSREHGE